MASQPRPSRPQPLRAHLRKSRPLFVAALSAFSVALGVLPGAAPAAAEPSAAEIEQQIDRAWDELEPVVERYNLTRTQLSERRKTADQLSKKIAPLQLQINIAMSRVGELATLQYKGGTASAANALFSGGPPTMLADRLEVIDLMARRQQSEISDVVLLKEKYDSQKAPLDDMIANLTKSEKQLGAKAEQIEIEIKKLEKMRQAAYGGSGDTGSLRPVPCPTNYPGGDAGKVMRFACAQIGKPYVFGAEGPGSYDCSGLTLRAWQQAGVGLPHNAAAQRGSMPSVSRDDLRPGDLVFYYGNLRHVGIYAGKADGTHWVVHAAEPGVPVKMAKMDVVGDIHSYGRPS